MCTNTFDFMSWAHNSHCREKMKWFNILKPVHRWRSLFAFIVFYTKHCIVLCSTHFFPQSPRKVKKRSRNGWITDDKVRYITRA